MPDSRASSVCSASARAALGSAAWVISRAASITALSTSWARTGTGAGTSCPSRAAAWRFWAGLDLAPGPPAEHGGRVGERDLCDLGSLADVQETAQPNDQAGGPVGGGRDGRGDLGGHLTLQLLEHGAEQLLLVGEVVVERAAGDAGRGHDLGGGHVRVAALGEQPSGGGHQRGSGGA